MTCLSGPGTAALLALSMISCATAGETGSRWELGIDESITWETVHVLSQPSTDSIPDEYATKDVTPVLSFRCTESGDGSIGMQIDWQRFISSFNTEAGFQVDEGKRQWIKLGVDDSNRITLARSTSDVGALIEQLSAGDNLSVEIAPYSEPSVFVSYDLAGFSDAVQALASGCK